MSNGQSSVALPEGLPEGLVAFTLLRSMTSICEDFIVEDHRLSRGFEIRRHLRVFRRVDTEWWSLLIPHVASLRTRDMRHVARLLEVGQLTDGIYLLTDDHPAVLADIVGPQPVSEKTVTRILSQIACGLAELHRHIGPHGNLCVRSIRTSKATLDQDLQVSIANTELGRLAVWSDFTLLPSGFQQNRPPEWKGDRTDQFTKEGDVYALGLIGAELLLGTANFRAACLSATNAKESLVETLEASLKAQGISRSSRRKLQRLLAIHPSDRPRDGQAANELLSSTVWDHWGWRVAAVVVVLMWLWLITHSGSSTPATAKQLQQRVEELQRDIADANSKASRLESTLEQKRQDLESLDKKLAAQTLELESSRSVARLNEEKVKRITELVTRPSPDVANKIATIVGTTPQSDPAEFAKPHWRALNLDQPSPKVLEDIDRLRKDKKLPDDQFRLLKSWFGQINCRAANWSAWGQRRRSEEAPFVETWTKYRKTPWDESLQQSVDRTSEALRNASRIWWDYASTSKSESWDVFRSNLETEAKAQSNPIVEKVLNAWMTEFNRRGTWTLRLGKATGAAGNGRWRLISMYLDGKWHKEDWREWSADISHDYRSADVPIAWRRGQSVEVLVEGERSYLTGTRPNFLDQTFGGPVALWSLHQAGVIGTKDFSLAIDVDDCPGPPRSIIQSLRKLATGSTAATTQTQK